MIWLAAFAVLLVADYLRLGRRLRRWLDPHERELGRQLRALRAQREHAAREWEQILGLIPSAVCCELAAVGGECSCSWAKRLEAAELSARAAREVLDVARSAALPRDRIAALERLALHHEGTAALLRSLRAPSRRAAGQGRRSGNHHSHRGRSRAARCAAPRVRGSRRTAARTALNTGPPGGDDGPSSDPPRSIAASPARRARHHATNPTPGANRRAERAKTTGRARRSVWGVGGTSRRVGEPRNDESPRGATLAGIPNRAGERGVTAGQTPRILADSRSATQTQARATEAASGG